MLHTGDLNTEKFGKKSALKVIKIDITAFRESQNPPADAKK